MRKHATHLAVLWRSHVWARAVAIASALIVLFFAVWEWCERSLLHSREPATPPSLHGLHLLRGIGASLAAAMLVAWLMVRANRWPSQALLDAPLERGPLTEEQWARNYGRWFIVLRWIAVVVSAAMVFLATHVSDVLPRQVWIRLSIPIIALAGCNVCYQVLLRRRIWSRNLLPVQILLDLLILTAMLHFSGGIENPLSLVMVFHVIIAGIMLDRRRCFLFAGIASGLYALLAFGELFGVLHHYTLFTFPHEHNDSGLTHAAHFTPYVVSSVTVQTVVLLLSAYFVTTLAERVLYDERQLAQMYRRQCDAQERLVRVSRLAAMGELAGKVAHEVNNPIGIVSAKARLLVDHHRGEMSAHVAGELEKITSQSDRVARVAQGLLTYCRAADPGRVAARVDVAVKRALDLIEPRARQAKVQIEQHVPDDLPPARVNPDEIEQVFCNLFINALDAMRGRNGGRLSVRAMCEEDQIVVAVQDSGCGMSDEVQRRIFEPFYTTKKDDGTGLGLSICQELVHASGGSITVQSEPGRGSTFTLRLAVARG